MTENRRGEFLPVRRARAPRSAPKASAKPSKEPPQPVADLEAAKKANAKKQADLVAARAARPVDEPSRVYPLLEGRRETDSADD